MGLLSEPYGPWPGNRRRASARGLGLLGGMPPEALEAASIGAGLPGMLGGGRAPYDPSGQPIGATVNNMFGLDPDMERGGILPLGRNPGGPTEFAAPQWLYEMAKALTLPGHVAMGGSYTDEDALNMAFTVAGGGGAAATTKAVPRGALAMGGSRPARGILPMDDASRMARAREMGAKPVRVSEPVHFAKGTERSYYDEAGRKRPTPVDFPRNPGRAYIVEGGSGRRMFVRFDEDPIAQRPHSVTFGYVDDYLSGKNPFIVDSPQGRAPGALGDFRAVGDTMRIDRARMDPPGYSWLPAEDRARPSRQNIYGMMARRAGMKASEPDKYSGVVTVPLRNVDDINWTKLREKLTDIPHTDKEAIKDAIGQIQVRDFYMLPGGHLRSPQAAFDPARADSADLLAANASPLFTSGLLAIDEERRQRRY